jgi:hypothetical protein
MKELEELELELLKKDKVVDPNNEHYYGNGYWSNIGTNPKKENEYAKKKDQARALNELRDEIELYKSQIKMAQERLELNEHDLDDLNHGINRGRQIPNSV